MKYFDCTILQNILFIDATKKHYLFKFERSVRAIQNSSKKNPGTQCHLSDEIRNTEHI